MTDHAWENIAPLEKALRDLCVQLWKYHSAFGSVTAPTELGIEFVPPSPIVISSSLQIRRQRCAVEARTRHQPLGERDEG